MKNKKLDRFIKAINAFGNHNFDDNKQLEKDLIFMRKKYDEGGGWNEGREHAQKELFKRIFKEYKI